MITGMPISWGIVGFLLGVTLALGAVFAIKQTDTNGLIGFLLEVGGHLVTLAVAGTVAAAVLFALVRCFP
jgi:hypothetical protein